jgi:diacylglycerol O-acyltransferase / wax synthase
MAGRQRMGVQDALWLEMDTPDNLMVVDSIFWSAAPVDWDAYVDLMERRLWDRYPVFRSAAVRDADGAWHWEVQPGAKLVDRFQRVTLPPPGGDAELQDLISSQRAVSLDRGEPLWRAILVDGFRGGSAVLFRGHHAIADGVRMVELVLSVFDTDPGPGRRRRARKVRAETASSTPQAPGAAPASWSPDAGLVDASLRLARNAATNPVGAGHSVLTLSRWLVGAAGAEARSVLSGGLGVVPGARPAFAAIPGDVDAARKLVLGTRNDNTCWTGPVGHHKRVSWSPPLPLADVRAVAHASGATVNDVLVTCVADSLRMYLYRHAALCRSVTWDVPVNLKPFDASPADHLGNGFALVQLELPTDIDDPVRTLQVVQRRMGRIKRGHEAVVDFGVQAAVSRLSRRMYRHTVDLFANRAVGVLTNVAGPQQPLYVAGQRIEGMMGWAPLAADQVMSFTIFSYDGKVFVGLAADARLVPDHDAIVGGFSAAFRRLSALTPPGA